MHKKIIALFTIFIFVTSSHLLGQVTIGSDNKPSVSSALELVSTTGGLRHPQLTTTERDKLLTGISNKSEAYGLTIYNTTVKCIEFYKNETEGWKNLCESLNIEEIPLDDQGATLRPYTSDDGAITEGDYGKLKFDVAVINSGGSCGTLSEDAGRAGDFKTATQRIRNYVVEFPNVTGITDLIVGKHQDPYSMIETVSGNIAGNVANLQNKVLVKFVANIDDIAKGTSEHNALKATIYAVFKRNGVYKRVECTITVMDCLGCGIRITADNSWAPYMCYNLGADDSLSPFVYNEKLEGDIYQWGRVADGHEKRTAKIFYPTVAVGELNFTTAPIDHLDTKGQVTTTSPRYGKFISSNTMSSKYFNKDWSAQHNKLLWGDGTQRLIVKKAVSDPCPTGFRLPTLLEMTDLKNASTMNGVVDGVAAKDDGLLFLPYAKYRNVSGKIDITSDGQYWTSTVADPSANLESEVWVGRIYGSTGLFKLENIARAYSGSVRCIAEQLND